MENLDKLDVALDDMFLEIGEKHAAIPQFSEGYIGVSVGLHVLIPTDKKHIHVCQFNKGYIRVHVVLALKSVGQVKLT